MGNSTSSTHNAEPAEAADMWQQDESTTDKLSGQIKELELVDCSHSLCESQFDDRDGDELSEYIISCQIWCSVNNDDQDFEESDNEDDMKNDEDNDKDDDTADDDDDDGRDEDNNDDGTDNYDDDDNDNDESNGSDDELVCYTCDTILVHSHAPTQYREAKQLQWTNEQWSE